jgi:hypothetical protein
MAYLWGRNWTKAELLERVGDISQIAGVRKSTLSEGRSKGVDVYDINTGTGFEFTLAPDRALDVVKASFNGQAIAWRSSTGDVHPAYYDKDGDEWLRSYFGGLVATCGITSVGAPCEDDGEVLGAHGRIGTSPAAQVGSGGYWEGDDYVMWVYGTMREGGVFNNELELRRVVSTKLGSNSFTIKDTVVNIGWQKSPFMILYHCNFGFPVVDDGSDVVTTAASVKPRDADAEDGKEEYHTLSAPVKDYAEKVYYHDVKTDAECKSLIGIVNRNRGLGGYIRYSKEELPYLIQWKQMGQGWYTCGLEPANCLVEGRDKDRADGRLQFLEPQEERSMELEIGVLPNAQSIAQFDAEVKSIRGERFEF